MTMTVGVKEASEQFADLLGSVQQGNEAIVVETNGKPVAVVISPDLYERYREAARERFFQTVEQIRADNAEEDQAQIDEDITAIVEHVRQEHYDREQNS